MSAPSTRPTNQDRIRAALWFAERGFGIFPVWSTRDGGTCRCPAGRDCSSPGKHPITNDGFKAATDDAQRITTFLSAASEPNYGMTCPDGVFALDVDGDGIGQLADLEARYGPLPATLRTRTANGQHIFLRWPDDHPRPLKQLFGYVTRWGTGKHAGYVIGPRSVHPSGVEYAPVEDSFDIATLPDAWAVAGVTARPSTVTVNSGPRLETVHTGGRHEFLRDRARTLRGGGLGGEALFDAVMQVNTDYCDPLKSADEVRRAIGDVETKYEPDPLPGTPAYEERQQEATEDVAGILGATSVGDFPAAPHPEAFEGLCGEIVSAMAANTDADEAGLLASFLALSGAVFPVHGYSFGEQTSSPFVALVGESSIGRKGTAMNRALDALRLSVNAAEVNALILDGLNSGEGLITALDGRSKYTRDLCAVIFEDEFASLLQSRGRDGSTLDPKMRAAFDGSVLSNRKAAGETTVHPPYWLPALTAITPDELRRRLEPGSHRSGSANRWLYVPVVRRAVHIEDAPPVLPRELQTALVKARDGGARRVDFEPAATARLSEYAAFVVTNSSGLACDLVKRYQTIAARLAMVHAALERDSVVRLAYLDRALALTEYARRGFLWVFGQTVGSPLADLLLRYLQAEGSLSASYITRHIERSAIKRQEAVDELLRLGYARVAQVRTKGRPRTDLQLDPSRRPFVAFSHISISEPESKGEGSWTEAPQTSVGSVEESRKEAGKKSEESGMKGGRKSNPERVIDHETGETQTVEDPIRVSASTDQTITCRDYRAHQGEAHVRSAKGWICTICSPEVESS